MNLHTPTPTQTDRVALSATLYSLSDGFLIESTMWKDPGAHEECQRCARSLAEIARGVVSGAADYAKAEAFSDAARAILGNVTGARRFFAAVLTPPPVGGE